MPTINKYTQFMERLALRTPIIQAPMANISTPQVASEVYKAGGLGSLPMSTVDLTKDTNPVFDLIHKFRAGAGANAPVNCNFFCFDPKEQHVPTKNEEENWKKLYSKASGELVAEIDAKVADFSSRAVVSFAEFEQNYPTECSDFIARLVDAKVGVVSFHFGIPSVANIRKFQQGNVLVLGTATSLAEARHLMEAGVDGIVCQGYEAGGHRGNYLGDPRLDEKLPTLSLFQLVVRAVTTGKYGEAQREPYIIPAGGIVDGKTAATYLKEGAAAVQLGTVFIPVKESGAPSYIGDSIANVRETPTIMTPLVSGRNARTLATPFIEKLVTEQEIALPLLPFGYSTSAYRDFANKRAEYGFYLAGANYHLVDTDMSTGEVMASLVAGLKNNGI